MFYLVKMNFDKFDQFFEKFYEFQFGFEKYIIFSIKNVFNEIITITNLFEK